MFCANCGKELAEKVNFCPFCGTNIDTEIVPESIEKEGNPIWFIIGIICAIISLFLFPPVFGGIAIYSGNKAVKEGFVGGGVFLMIASGILMIVGMINGCSTAMSNF